MRINDNGIYREMKPEEAEYQSQNKSVQQSEYTTEERLTIIEDAFAELCEVIFNG